jgi:hypothetical protein
MAYTMLPEAPLKMQGGCKHFSPACLVLKEVERDSLLLVPNVSRKGSQYAPYSHPNIL